MLRSINKFLKYNVRSIDDVVGNIYDFFFENDIWKIRYAVVDTRDLKEGKLSLLPIESLGLPNDEQESFSVQMTTDQILEGPSIETNEPVQDEAQENAGLPPWSPSRERIREMEEIPDPGDTPFPESIIESTEEKLDREAQDNPYLSSLKNVVGYLIKGRDVEIGLVQDFLADDQSWDIRHAAVRLENDPSQRSVLVPILAIDKFDWQARRLTCDLTLRQVERAPSYDQRGWADEAYESKVLASYRQ